MIYRDFVSKLKNKDFQIIDQKYKRSVVFLDGEKILPWRIDLMAVERVRNKEPIWNIYLSEFKEEKELDYFLKWKRQIDLKVLIGYEDLKTGGFRHQNSKIIVYKIEPRLLFSTKQLLSYFKGTILYKSERLKLIYL